LFGKILDFRRGRFGERYSILLKGGFTYGKRKGIISKKFVIVASLTKMGYNLSSIRKRRKQTCLYPKQKIIQLKISTHFLMDSVRSFLMEKSI
jgi:hypothetical protein